MRFFSVLKLILIAQLVLAPAWIFAQIQTKKISFPAGKSSTKVSGTIKGDQTIDYTVSAKAGQQLIVTLSAKNASLYFNVLPPGSNDVAIFIGSTEGNKYNGTLNVDGVYKIRVYLMRSAARRNESSKYELSVNIPPGESKSTDAKVPGTPYHATGKVPAALGTATKGSVQADFGVIRKSAGTAELHLKIPNGSQQKITFERGEWTCLNCKNIKYTKNADEWAITINGSEHYYVPEAVITGG
ncbi:MAG TPA: PPC domain-containing protein [Chitinophagaceae bacterium]|nr:PPC domain-containing protein [Chitinophagaceae bacterium]